MRRRCCRQRRRPRRGRDSPSRCRGPRRRRGAAREPRAGRAGGCVSWSLRSGGSGRPLATARRVAPTVSFAELARSRHCSRYIRGVEPLERARQVTAEWDERLRADLPTDLEIFDAHTHLGTDIDAMVGRPEELIGSMDRYGISRAFMFCLDEPDRHPGFRAGNDRTLEFAASSDGRLVPFVRLALDEGPIEEARRCLDLGARGIKLHPRAQKFLLNDERLAPVFALAAERNVPILIHGGRGLPPIADNLRRLVDSNPGAQLIIAHAGIADLGALAAEFGGMAGVYFDTSVWSPIDLLSLYHLVSPEQVVYASDYPYGQQPSSLLIAVRTATLAGFGDKELRRMLSGTANRIANGEPPLEAR